jgi:SAM-dependent methyltransferase
MSFMIAHRRKVALRAHSNHNLFVSSFEPLPQAPATPDIPGFRPDRCATYLAGTAAAPPRAQLLAAIEAWKSQAPQAGVSRHAAPIALDVGCGPGREMVALLEAGFAVDAIDPYPEMIDLARTAVTAARVDLSRVYLAVGTLEDHAASLAIDRYDIVHAGFVLPFVRPAAFDRCWDALTRTLRDGGIFAGQFFGAHDEFILTAAPSEMTSHTAAELDALFRDWHVIEREEVERDGCVGRGVAKHWHVHHIVARKPSGTRVLG